MITSTDSLRREYSKQKVQSVQRNAGTSKRNPKEGFSVCEILAIAEDNPILGSQEQKALAVEMAAGNYQAQTKLLYCQMRSIVKLSRSSCQFARSNSFEDTLQEAIAFVWMTLPKYKIGSNAKPSSYCYVALRNYLRGWQASSGDVIEIPIDAVKAKSEKARLAYLCIRDDSLLDRLCVEQNNDALEIPQEYQIALFKALRCLSQEERSLLESYQCLGNSQELLALKTGVSRQAIRQKIYRIMRKLRALFFRWLHCSDLDAPIEFAAIIKSEQLNLFPI